MYRRTHLRLNGGEHESAGGARQAGDLKRADHRIAPGVDIHSLVLGVGYREDLITFRAAQVAHARRLLALSRDGEVHEQRSQAAMADAPASPEAEGATPEAPEPTEPQADLGDEGKKALDSERKARRDAERAHKAATAELEKLRQQSMTEQEKAVAAARAEGLAEGTRNAGVRLVDAEVRAAAAGRGVDTDALLEGLDRHKFLGDEGEPDRDAITAYIDRIAPASEEPQPAGFPSLEQGARTNPALGSNALESSLKSKLGIR